MRVPINEGPIKISHSGPTFQIFQSKKFNTFSAIIAKSLLDDR